MIYSSWPVTLTSFSNFILSAQIQKYSLRAAFGPSVGDCDSIPNHPELHFVQEHQHIPEIPGRTICVQVTPKVYGVRGCFPFWKRAARKGRLWQESLGCEHPSSHVPSDASCQVRHEMQVTELMVGVTRGM